MDNILTFIFLKGILKTHYIVEDCFANVTISTNRSCNNTFCPSLAFERGLSGQICHTQGHKDKHFLLPWQVPTGFAFYH